MPPKIKITKEDIVNAAVELIRKNGEDALNARAIASALNCSTQPIFSNFATMEELQTAVLTAVYDRYLVFLQDEAASGKYPQYKSFGMAYMRFAKEEKELFKLLFMRDRNGAEGISSPDFDASVNLIMNDNGISKEKATLMHLEMWICVHGIATMLATSFFTPSWELISNITSDVYHGIRTRHLSEET